MVGMAPRGGKPHDGPQATGGRVPRRLHNRSRFREWRRGGPPWDVAIAMATVHASRRPAAWGGPITCADSFARIVLFSVRFEAVGTADGTSRFQKSVLEGGRELAAQGRDCRPVP